MLLLACLLIGSAAAAPTSSYDQRQDGDFNVRADVQNVVFLVAIPQKLSLPTGLLELLLRSNAKSDDPVFQDRSDTPVLKFVEPKTPYQVEIGGGSEGRNVEVLIAGRRRLEDESHGDGDEYKLLGATEQCGPDGERDPVSLVCRTTVKSEPSLQAAKTVDVAAPPELGDDKVTPSDNLPAAPALPL